MNAGDFVSWATRKGRYVGSLVSMNNAGKHQVVTSDGGTETIEASQSEQVGIVRVYINNEDGTYTRSDRNVAVRWKMLRKIKKPETKGEEKASAAVKKVLKEKAEKHNADVGNVASKRTNVRTLSAVFDRGVGAYQTNPGSVRPTVTSAEQWAYARVNSFLYALRNGRFRGGKHDTDLLPAGHPQSSKSKKVEKGPKCRQATETYDECVSRKIGELIDEDGYERDQAIAVARSMCETSCADKEKSTHDVTNFPKRGDDQKVSLANSQYKQFPLAEAQRLKDEWPQIWRKGGNILGNTQFNRLKKVKETGVKTPTDEKAVRLREAWSARHYRDHMLAGVIAQVKWLMVGSRGISHMLKVISDEKARLRKSQNK